MGQWPVRRVDHLHAALEGIAVRGDVALVRMPASLRRFVPAESCARWAPLAKLDALIAAARPARWSARPLDRRLH